MQGHRHRRRVRKMSRKGEYRLLPRGALNLDAWHAFRCPSPSVKTSPAHSTASLPTHSDAAPTLPSLVAHPGICRWSPRRRLRNALRRVRASFSLTDASRFADRCSFSPKTRYVPQDFRHLPRQPPSTFAVTYTGDPPAIVRAAVDYVLNLFDGWLVLSSAAPVRINFEWTNLTTVSVGLLCAPSPCLRLYSHMHSGALHQRPGRRRPWIESTVCDRHSTQLIGQLQLSMLPELGSIGDRIPSISSRASIWM